jgi:hypothetical protein
MINLPMSEKADEEVQKPAGARTRYPPNDLVELYHYSVKLIG